MTENREESLSVARYSLLEKENEQRTTSNEQHLYNPFAIEKKWQDIWEKKKLFQASDAPKKPKCYILEQFPYPSGRLHMGHLRLYTLGDVLARYKRARGFEVMHPMGWDAFGLPAENAAIENKIHPAEWTYKNIDNMRAQLKAVGLSYDWSREIATCAPEYYMHEQKMFLDFLQAGIAYRKESMVNWDPVDNTVLANEQVIDGRGWRSGALIERKKLTQWFLKITDFAADLLAGLETLPGWPERVLTMQEKWIGKSEGALIDFEVSGSGFRVSVYTTRPDTIFGASFIAISAQHPLALECAKRDKGAAAFIEEAGRLGVAEEAIEKAEKKGYDTGLKAVHPFADKAWSVERGMWNTNHEPRTTNHDLLPIYIANFVLMEYGTGALFGCPAHDERDFEFAEKYGLPVRQVVKESQVSSPKSQEKNLGVATCNLQLPFTGDGIAINSDFLNGLPTAEAKSKAIAELEKIGAGTRKINYRLRDWGISRQRYWGCPIPIIHCEKCGVVPVPRQDLPVVLPDDVEFDKPGNPLDRHPTWKHVSCPECSGKATRETDTFDTFIESSWYFARFCSPHSPQGIDKKTAETWLPVDYYLGGIEHAVLHLLYSRFFMRALAKCGYTDIKEPFKGLLTQGMVCRETYKDKAGNWLYPEDVEKKDGNFIRKGTGEEVKVGRTEKMSKSKKNVVSPEAILEKYGADTARLFMLSDSPPERDLEWSDAGVDSAARFLGRLWKMADSLSVVRYSFSESANNEQRTTSNVLKSSHKTIASVTETIEKFQLNSAVARIRELANSISDAGVTPESKGAFEILIRLIYPMAPHIAEEIWEFLGNETLLAESDWPVANPDLIADNSVTIAVQVNGKLKGTIELPTGAPEGLAKERAIEIAAVKAAIGDKPVKKIIFVPGKILNVVI